MSSTPTPHPDNPPETWPGVAAGLAIYLVACLVLIVSELPRGIQAPALSQTLTNLGFWCFILAPATGVAIGWIMGFPRWSYPYAPLAALQSLYFSVVSTPGLTFLGYPTFGRELWGWRAFLPLLLGGSIAWLVTRSFQPLGRFFTQMRQDWTLATYALSGTLPLVIFIAYDEMDRVYSLRDMILLSILMLGMALIYLRSRSKRQRGLTLAIGIPLILGFTAISTTAYWLSLGPGNVYIPGMLIWTVVLITFYLSPGIFSAWMRIVLKPAPEA
jgi:hypothetical protein